MLYLTGCFVFWLKDLSGQMVFFNPVCALFLPSSIPPHITLLLHQPDFFSLFLPLRTEIQRYFVFSSFFIAHEQPQLQ